MFPLLRNQNVLIALAIVLGVAAALAVPASHQARVTTGLSTRAVTIPCEPAYEMTARQRAALLAMAPQGSGFRECTPGSSTKIRVSTKVYLTAFQKFLSKTSAQFTNVSLQHVACDNRTVYADVTDANGFLGEFYNAEPCGHTAYFPGPDLVSSPDHVDYVFIKLYDCNLLTCSSVVNSGQHWNPYLHPGNPISSTFNFCNNTGPNKTNISCFHGDLN